MMMNGKRVHTGFTLMEILMAVFFMGAVAMFTVPKIMETTGTQTAYAKAKNMASYLQAAAEKLKEEDPGLNLEDATIPAQIANRTKYVTIVTSGMLLTDPDDFEMPDCDSVRPCYRFADGGVLMVHQWFNEEAPDPTAVFIYDPDNTGNIGPMTLMMNFETERTAPKDAFLNGEAYYDTSNNPPEDPAYLRHWTRM